MSKFIEISGEDEYSAMIFESQDVITIKDIYKEMVDTNVKFLEKEINDEIIYFRLMEFDNVDENFVNYVFDEFVDYDFTKDKDLIKIE